MRPVGGMSNKPSVQVATLERARDLAGGVTYLAAHLEVGVDKVESMLQQKEVVPTWLFLRAVDFLNERSGTTPPGLPDDWEKKTRADPKNR